MTALTSVYFWSQCLHTQSVCATIKITLCVCLSVCVCACPCKHVCMDSVCVSVLSISERAVSESRERVYVCVCDCMCVWECVCDTYVRLWCVHGVPVYVYMCILYHKSRHSNVQKKLNSRFITYASFCLYNSRYICTPLVLKVHFSTEENHKHQSCLVTWRLVI